jgi:hypothetical protein
MAVRLQTKLGVVPEADRLPDSADSVLVTEPSIGAVARSKGSLYLVVTARGGGSRLRSLTRLVAETIRAEYYYDESAGIRIVLEKAIDLANKRLLHERGPWDPTEGGPIGVALAVVRGTELYVSTAGPAEAYLVRGARLSTLPDPERERGLPYAGLRPDVWRGEFAVGDSLLLVSPNLAARLGPEALKDALVTLHPQSAVEHLHHRFVAAGGTGSDAALAIELTEVAATTRTRTLEPVRAPEPLAGAPDRGPFPLADQVSEGVAALGTQARTAGRAARSVLDRLVLAAQDRLPRRPTVYRRVTPYSARREQQRRAAVAVLAFVLVAGGLGLAVYAAGGGPPREAVASLTAGQRALNAANEAIATVWAPGVDLVTGDPRRARQLLETAYEQLAAAERAGIPSSTTEPLRRRVVEGLDRLFGVVPVATTLLFSFEGAETPTDLRGLVIGPDGAPFVLDRATKSVYRIDVAGQTATAILREGTKASGATAAEPRFLFVGGPDVLVFDAANQLWRWRPANTSGKGTLARIPIKNSASLGDDVRAVGTYVRNASLGLYNLYIVDPSARQILMYSPAADGSGYPADPTGRLATERDVGGFEALYIDGDIFVTDEGVIERFVSGRSGGWSAEPPPDELLRPAPHYRFLASASPRRLGRLYAYDARNGRIVAYEKATGAYVEQYRLAGGDPAWRDLRGMAVVAGSDDVPDTIIWIDRTRLVSSLLEGVPDRPAATPRPSPNESVVPSPSASAP